MSNHDIYIKLRKAVKTKLNAGRTVAVVGHGNFHKTVLSAIVLLESGKTKYVGDFSKAAHSTENPMLVGESKLGVAEYAIPVALKASVAIVQVVDGVAQTSGVDWHPIVEDYFFSDAEDDLADEISQVYHDGKICITNQNGRKIVKDAAVRGVYQLLEKYFIIAGEGKIPVILELPTGADTSEFGAADANTRFAVRFDLETDKLSDVCEVLPMSEPAACPTPLATTDPCNCNDTEEEEEGEEAANTPYPKNQYCLLAS